MKAIYEQDIMKYRKHLRDTIHVLKRQKDSDRKFEKLLDMTKKYELMTIDLEKTGHKVRCTADWMRHSYWVNEYEKYCLANGIVSNIKTQEEPKPLTIAKPSKTNTPKTVKIPTVKIDKTPIKKKETKPTAKSKPKASAKQPIVQDKSDWKITLAWTISSQLNCNSCNKVIDNLKKYFLNMGLTEIGKDEYDFGNRYEYNIYFLFNGTETEYIIIRNSAEYISTVIDASYYEKCNVGIYGKKIEKS